MEGRPRIVAIVEDDPSMRTSVERLLNAHGFPTESYGSAEKFLGRGDASAFGCLVLDINLRGMSGIELRRRLNSSGVEFPVVFITAVDDKALELEATQLGCVAYLNKPFPAALLIGAVNKAMGSR